MQNDYMYTVTQEQMITITCEYIQQPLQRCACTSKASTKCALIKTGMHKTHRHTSACLTGCCLNKYSALKGQLQQAATRRQNMRATK